MVGLNGDERRKYCCKKQSIPYNFLQFYQMFPQEEEHQQMSENCSESFKTKQLELDPELKKAIEKLDNSFDESLNNTSDESGSNPRELLINVTFNVFRHNYFIHGT